MEQKTFHSELRKKMDDFAHTVYRVTKKFPKEELFGITSQLRRASLSVILNYVEGYARGIGRSYKNFLLISYGSLQESKYLLEFSFEEAYLPNNEYDFLLGLSNEIGAMIWSTIHKL